MCVSGVCVCVCVCVCVKHNNMTCVEVRGQLEGLDSLISPCGSWGSNSELFSHQSFKSLYWGVSPSPVTPLDTVQHPVACSVTNSFVSQLCVAGDTHSTEYKYQLKRTHTWRKRRQWGLVNALIFQSLLLMMVLKRFNLPSSPPPTKGSEKKGD